MKLQAGTGRLLQLEAIFHKGRGEVLGLSCNEDSVDSFLGTTLKSQIDGRGWNSNGLEIS